MEIRQTLIWSFNRKDLKRFKSFALNPRLRRLSGPTRMLHIIHSIPNNIVLEIMKIHVFFQRLNLLSNSKQNHLSPNHSPTALKYKPANSHDRTCAYTMPQNQLKIWCFENRLDTHGFSGNKSIEKWQWLMTMKSKNDKIEIEIEKWNL